MTIRTYQTPVSFKAAVEQRLRDASASGVDFGRRRQLLVFDRLLARLTQVLGEAVTLKGGLVLEIRLSRARTTKDVDVRMMGSAAEVLARLQRAGQLDLGDYMTFEVQPDRRHPTMRGDGMKYDGLRFRAECRLAAKLYGQPFGVDVAFGDPIIGEPEIVVGDDVLGFAGIKPPTVRIYPIESHIAEKLHAYTLPRKRPNTRVKDLPDIALLASARRLEAQQLMRAIEATFGFRATHAVPASLPPPPSEWEDPYREMAQEDGLAWPTLDVVAEAAKAFLDPALAGGPPQWDPDSWEWT